MSKGKRTATAQLSPAQAKRLKSVEAKSLALSKCLDKLEGSAKARKDQTTLRGLQAQLDRLQKTQAKAKARQDEPSAQRVAMRAQTQAQVQVQAQAQAQAQAEAQALWTSWLCFICLQTSGPPPPPPPPLPRTKINCSLQCIIKLF